MTNRAHCSLEVDPDRRMIAGTLPPTYLPINAGRLQLLREHGTEQDVIKPQAGISFPSLPQIVPKREEAFVVRMHLAKTVGPSLLQEFLVCRAWFWLEQGIIVPGLGRIDIAISWNHVEVPGQYDR